MQLGAAARRAGAAGPTGAGADATGGPHPPTVIGCGHSAGPGPLTCPGPPTVALATS